MHVDWLGLKLQQTAYCFELAMPLRVLIALTWHQFFWPVGGLH